MNGRAYYNEIDPYAAQWLRNLIAAGHIAPGDVDERSIVDVRPNDLAGYGQCHFFAGLGGWSGALRLAGIPDYKPLWTGSCPCQPFSLAGKQKGFDDDRHLWPVWRELIRERCPARVFGEQVASASAWLGLVRGDLEDMDYAVGAMPVQAAGAGADHLRDRYWFVANANDAGPQGRQLLPKRAGERVVGPDGLSDADKPCEGSERQQRGGEFGGARSYPKSCNSGNLADPVRDGARDTARGGDRSQTAPIGINRDTSRASASARIYGSSPMADSTGERLNRSESAARSRGRSGAKDGSLDWVIGADGKARRVKPGIRLLAHGVPARVAKLRALGNAIDLRPAAQFILAAQEAIGDLT